MKKIYLNPWILFLPFLLIFLFLVLKFPTHGNSGDESRYLAFAHNLVNGFYSPKGNLNLWNGPGYPIILIPFVFFKLPLLAITILNALFQYLSIVLLFLAIKQYTNNKTALFFSLFWACYYLSYQELPSILTEPFTSFLITLTLFFLSRFFKSNSSKYGIAAGISIGFLILTKIIFGYVIIAMLCIYIIALIAKSFYNSNIFNKCKKLLMILLVAFAILLPYLIYTHSLTNRFFYMGNSGGMSLYWMSTPFENEYGDWNNETFTANCGLGQPCNSNLIAKNHQKDIDYVDQFHGIEKDDAYRRLAIKNIKSNPVKYLKNCFANQERLWFGIPASYFYQRDTTLIRIIPNSLLLGFFILTFFLWLKNIFKTKSEINFIFFLILIYLFLSTLVSAYPRQLNVIVPVLLFWGSYIHFNTTTFKFNWENK